MKLLVPVDGSERSLRAVALAIAMVAGSGSAELLLVTVQNLAPPGAFDLGLLDPILVQAAAVRVGEKTLRKAAGLVESAKLRFATRVEMGPIPQTLARVARNEGVDHIVMGARGQPKGAFATQLMQLAKVPVTLVK